MEQGSSARTSSQRVRTMLVCMLAATAMGAFLPALAGANASSHRRDADKDGLTNRFERKVSHTNPRRGDTDRDKLSDRYEVRRSHTNPRRKDTDRDGLSDWFEIRRSHTNPRRKDTDKDGMNDGAELRVLRNPLVPESSPQIVLPLGEELPSVPQPGGGGDTPAPTAPTPNPLAPDTTIGSGPSGTSDSDAATFTFSSSQSLSTFTCRLDGSAWAACTSPTSYSELADGSHTFEVAASNVFGLTDASPASRTWTVDVSPPPDTTAPQTTISSGPSGTTTTASASFGFASSETGSTFRCRLDGSAWAACTSPKSYSGLADGSHTFDVAATDAAGNADASPASRTWTVDVSPPPDTTAPQTSISSGPSGTSTSASASFAFSSFESGSTFRCRLDGSAWAACTSPTSYSGLADGSHTFEVAATDAAGNADASPASRTWTVDVSPPPDTTAPQTTISSGPSGTTTTASASFGFASSETGSTFRCRLDGSAWAACTSPKSYSGLADGSHTFDVAATDAAGNADASPASRTWTVDASTPPDGGSNCLASAECYPKPTNSGTGATGVPSGKTPATGCTTSPASGVTLTECLYTGGVTITTTGSGATIRFSEFRGQVTHAGSGTLTIESSNFGPASGCQNYDNSITGSNYTVRSSRFNTHVSEGPRVAGSNILIEDNFIGPMCSNPADHADGIQGYGGGTNIVVRHNTIDMRTASNVTSPIFFADDSRAGDVQGNLVAGGGYSIRLHDDSSPDRGPWVLKGNRIVNGAWTFGPFNNAGTSFTASTCSDNRLVGIDAGYNVTSVGAVVNC